MAMLVIHSPLRGQLSLFRGWQLQGPFSSGFFSSKIFFVVGTYYRSYVGHAAIADFDCASIKNLMELVIPWEMGFYQLKEFLTDVRLDSLAVRRSEPNHIYPEDVQG